VTEQQYNRVRRRLSAALKRRRKALSLTQEDVAELLGLVSRQYQKIEAGEVNVTLRTLARLSGVLRCKPRDLI
jgi:transcriptional regulator with XRE-family HTH domain